MQITQNINALIHNSKKYTKVTPKILQTGTKVYYESDSLNLTKIVEKSNGTTIMGFWQPTIGWLPDSLKFGGVIENTNKGQIIYTRKNGKNILDIRPKSPYDKEYGELFGSNLYKNSGYEKVWKDDSDDSINRLKDLYKYIKSESVG